MKDISTNWKYTARNTVSQSGSSNTKKSSTGNGKKVADQIKKVSNQSIKLAKWEARATYAAFK